MPIRTESSLLTFTAEVKMAKKIVKLTTKQIEEVPKEVKKSFSLKLRPQDLREFYPLTKTQEHFYDIYETSEFTALHGVAGTGKTFIALYKALEDVLSKSIYKKIIIIRSCVQSRDMGYLPGDEKDKMDRYALPYKQICSRLFENKEAYTLLEENNLIEFMSTSFLRGTSYNNSIILLDEFQNCNYEELATVITRVGDNSKIIFCGDIRQTDLRKANDPSGLRKFFQIASSVNAFNRIEFGIEDICRSDLVKEWIIAELDWKEK